MKKMFLLLNHTLTDEQKKNARDNLEIEAFIPLKDDLKKLWSNIDPEKNNISTSADKFITYLSTESNKGDYVLVQGDYGMTFAIVTWCLENKRIPVYSTTKRVYETYTDKNGDVVNKHVIKPVRFREYG